MKLSGTSCRDPRLIFTVFIFLIVCFEALIISAQLPLFSKDSQYYLQTGHLWTSGDIVYSGGLIGSRIFSILTYYVFQAIFGHSIDSISIALGTIFFVFCAVAVLWAFLRHQSLIRYMLSVSLIIWITLYWPIWSRALSENIFSVCVITSLLLFDLSRRSSNKKNAIWFLVFCGLITGLANGVRSEAMFLVGGMAVAVMLQHPLFSRLKHRGLVACGLFLVFFCAKSLNPVAFKLFTGHSVPPQVTGYFLFLQPIRQLGVENDSEFAKKIYQRGEELIAKHPQVAKNTDPIRLGFNKTFVEEGPEEASKLFFMAGIDTVRKHPERILSIVKKTLKGYLWLHKVQYASKEKDYESHFQATHAWLKKVDQLRIDLSDTRFGGEGTWPVASLMETRLQMPSFFEKLKRFPYVVYIPPSRAVTILLIASLLVCLAIPRMRGSTLMVTIIFFSMGALITSFAQDQRTRYWLVWALPFLVSLFVELSSLKFSGFRFRQPLEKVT